MYSDALYVVVADTINTQLTADELAVKIGGKSWSCDMICWPTFIGRHFVGQLLSVVCHAFNMRMPGSCYTNCGVTYLYVCIPDAIPNHVTNANLYPNSIPHHLNPNTIALMLTAINKYQSCHISIAAANLESIADTRTIAQSLRIIYAGCWCNKSVSNKGRVSNRSRVPKRPGVKVICTNRSRVSNRGRVSNRSRWSKSFVLIEAGGFYLKFYGNCATWNLPLYKVWILRLY